MVLVTYSIIYPRFKCSEQLHKLTDWGFKVVWNNFVLKVIFMHVQENLESFAKMLKNPVEIPLEIGEGAGKTVKKLAESVLGLLGGGRR